MMMEDGRTDCRVTFEQQVMSEIKLLTTKLDGLQQHVSRISQTLDDHLATCHFHPRGDLGDRDHDLRQPKQAEIRRRRHTSEDHKQACLRKSLQVNIIMLVDSLPFTESELGDMLISAECLTEDECSDLRRCLPRKDQIRNLIRLIKGRSFKVMSNFLNCVNHISPDIAHRIWATYGENLKTQCTKNVCTFCCLRHSVDIKLLADHVWSIGAIPDVLYDEIVSCPQPNESHWFKMTKECNKPENARRAMDVICGALDSKGHYNDLVPRLRRKTKLECYCFRQETGDMSRHVQPEVGDDDCDSSVSPNSSVLGDFERSPLSDISSNEDLVDTPYTDVLDSAWIYHGNHEDALQSPMHGFRGFRLRQRSDTRDANINIFRVRSNSFGKSSAAKRPISQRRASMIT